MVKRFIRKFGKYLLFTEKELETCEKWMHKYKNSAVFIARLMPGVRTVISLAAGIVKLPLYSFIILTFIGSFVWSIFLAWIGYVLGQNWKSLGGVFHKFDALIVVAIILGVGYYVFRRLKEAK